MCDKAVELYPWMLEYVPDQFKTQEMCNKAVEKDPGMLRYVLDRFITQEMCNKVVEKYSIILTCVPDQFKNQNIGARWTLKMYNKCTSLVKLKLRAKILTANIK